MKPLLFLLTVVLWFDFLQEGHSLKFLMPGGWTECISHDVQEPARQLTGGLAMTPLQLGNEVQIKVEISNPEGQMVWALPVSHEVEFAFQVKSYGKYKICFINTKQAAYAEIVFLESDATTENTKKAARKPHGDAEDRSQDLASDSEVQAIRYQLMVLASSMNILIGEQRMIKHKYEWQVDRAKHIHSRTLWFTLTEAAVLLMVSFAQVYCIRQLFNESTATRRPVVKGLFNASGPAPMARTYRY